MIQENKYGQVASTSSKVYEALKFVPAILLALLAALAFIFLCTPVAVMDLGELGSESLGNAYSVFKKSGGDELEDLGELMGPAAIPGMKTVIIVAVVVAAVTAAYAILSLAFTLIRYHRNVGLKLENGVVFSTSRIISLAGSVFYIAIAVVGCVMLSKISAADEGAGLLKAGTCPALLIAFGVVFLVLTIVEEVVHVFLTLKSPDCKRGEDEYLALVDEYAKTLPEPVRPEIPQSLRQGMQGLGEDEMRKKLKRSGRQAFQNAIIGLYIGVASIAVSIVLFAMGGKFGGGGVSWIGMMRIVLIFVGIAALALGAFLMTRPKIKFARAEKAYIRHTRLFKKGKNYLGARGFNAWLIAGRNSAA